MAGGIHPPYNKLRKRGHSMIRKSKIKFIDSVRKIAGKAINRYSLIESEDSVLVALSGGKDSLVLLDILISRLKYIPIHYHIYAAHINIEGIPKKVDIDYLSSFCRDLQVPFFYKHVTIKRGINSGKSPCFVCSWNKRKELFLLAKELGCNKVAFGHHLDDIVETLLMNMTLHGKFTTMPPKLSMFKGNLFIIRPLALLTGAEISRYAKLKQLRYTEDECEFGDNTKREEIKKILYELKKVSGKAKKNIFNSMSNIDLEYLAQG
jgi:tRNA 2-thiocytidine biosynthesis protein TtcA